MDEDPPHAVPSEPASVSPQEPAAPKTRRGADPAVLEFAGLLPAQSTPRGTGDNLPCRLNVHRRHYDYFDVPLFPPESPNCPRCSPSYSDRCCDLHLTSRPPTDPLPSWMTRFLDVMAPALMKRTYRARPLKTHKPSEKEETLRTLLREWRVTAHAERRPRLRQGPTALLSDQIITRIVSIAHRQSAPNPPMKTPSDLRLQTQWENSDRYGVAVLACIAQVFPPWQRPVLADRTNASGNARRPPTCSSCTQAGLPAFGHRKNDNRCPLKARWIEDRQNVPAASKTKVSTPMRTTTAALSTPVRATAASHSLRISQPPRPTAQSPAFSPARGAVTHNLPTLPTNLFTFKPPPSPNLPLHPQPKK